MFKHRQSHYIYAYIYIHTRIYLLIIHATGATQMGRPSDSAHKSFNTCKGRSKGFELATHALCRDGKSLVRGEGEIGETSKVNERVYTRCIIIHVTRVPQKDF